MKTISFDKMASLEGGSTGSYNRVCNSGKRLLTFAEDRQLGFLIFLACMIIRAYCPSSCACNGDAS